MTAPAQPTAGCPMSPLPDGMKTPRVRSGPISKTIRVLSARHVAKPTTRCRARRRRSRSGRSRRCAFTCLACASPAPPRVHLVRAQVRRTHGYYESNYALQNDCGLSFGESTASAVFRADMLGTKGTDGAALLCVNELTKLAAERSCRSREAVRLMGGVRVRVSPNPNPNPNPGPNPSPNSNPHPHPHQVQRGRQSHGPLGRDVRLLWPRRRRRRGPHGGR